eukprot:GEMP01028022.1.p1 GENE.GEMP01028022.1~~GEMP01028022.1.p1  ORF type:complete len:453 (+),score=92.49 GEMP01028022.1:99-1457(+)
MEHVRRELCSAATPNLPSVTPTPLGTQRWDCIRHIPWVNATSVRVSACACVLPVCLPAVARGFRLLLLADLPARTGIGVAAQMMGVYVLLDVIHEVLLQPLYQILNDTPPHAQAPYIALGLLVTMAAHSMVGVLLFMLAPAYVALCGVRVADQDMAELVVWYVRMEMLATVFMAEARYLVVKSSLRESAKMKVPWLLVVHMGASMVLDACLISEWDTSFKIGVVGIAASNAVASGLCCGYGIFTFRRDIRFRGLRASWHAWRLRLSPLVAIESVVRNVVYLIVTIRMVELVQQTTTFLYADEIIWTLVYLLFEPLSKLLKQDTPSTPHGKLTPRRRMSHWEHAATYTFVALVLVELWVGVWLFALYMLSTLMSSVFYSPQKTEVKRDVQLVQSVAANLLFLLLFGCFHAGWISLSLESIGFFFASNLAFDFLIASCASRYLLKRKKQDRFQI